MYIYCIFSSRIRIHLYVYWLIHVMCDTQRYVLTMLLFHGRLVKLLPRIILILRVVSTVLYRHWSTTSFYRLQFVNSVYSLWIKYVCVWQKWRLFNVYKRISFYASLLVCGILELIWTWWTHLCEYSEKSESVPCTGCGEFCHIATISSL